MKYTFRSPVVAMEWQDNGRHEEAPFKVPLNIQQVQEINDVIDKDNLAEYIWDDDPLFGKIEKISIKISEDNTEEAITEVISTDILNKDELENLKEYITGQFSDGWGEGFEQIDFFRHSYKADIGCEECDGTGLKLECSNEGEEYEIKCPECVNGYYTGMVESLVNVHFWDNENWKIELIEEKKEDIMATENQYIFCTTNIDKFQNENWPKRFLTIPKVGDYVKSEAGVKLKITSVTHCFSSNQFGRCPNEPYIELYLDRVHF